LINRMVEVPVFCISISVLVVKYFRPLQIGQARYVGVGIVAFLLLIEWVKKEYAIHKGAVSEPWLVGSAVC